MTQLSRLPVSERLELVQELWDSIEGTRDELPIQEWHRELVNARLREFDGRESEIGLTRAQIWDRVDGNRGT
jgi:putative addiction module component (TIGR02574 family)